MEGDLLARMKSLHLRGEGEIQESCFNFIYFRSLFTIWKSIKWITNPSKKASLFSVRSQRSDIKPGGQ